MRHVITILTIGLYLMSTGTSNYVSAQELNAKVSVNSQQINGTDKSVFESLEKNMTQLLNETQWTEQQYDIKERIACTFNLTLSSYSAGENLFKGSMLVQSTRPVFNSSYTTYVFGIKDDDFNFTFQEFDQLSFRLDQIDNDLTALLAYYAYLIIGLDMDTMSSLGGTEVLQQAQTVVNSANSLTTSAKGWKAFDDKKNRYAIINDYLDGGMEDFRKMQYTYHRKGLDIMANNADKGREAITESIQLLKKAHETKPLSYLPQLFTEIKRDELVNIYSGKGNAAEKEPVKDILSNINPSLNPYWNKLIK